jgi:hypothetical protein
MTNSTTDAELIYQAKAEQLIKSPLKDIPKRKPLTSYVDLTDLDEALSMYFNNELDFVDPVNCNKGLSALVPGNTLASQLEQSDMQHALEELDGFAQLTLTYYQGHRDRLEAKDYAIALNRLAEVVLEML